MCGNKLHFDDRYKINGRQEGEAEVLQAHFEQVAKWAGNWQEKKKKKTKNTRLRGSAVVYVLKRCIVHYVPFAKDTVLKATGV